MYLTISWPSRISYNQRVYFNKTRSKKALPPHFWNRCTAPAFECHYWAVCSETWGRCYTDSVITEHREELWLHSAVPLIIILLRLIHYVTLCELSHSAYHNNQCIGHNTNAEYLGLAGDYQTSMCEMLAGCWGLMPPFCTERVLRFG